MSARKSFIKSDLARLDAMTDADIDYSEIEELSDEFLEHAKQVIWPPEKQRITIRVDRDVLEWLKGQGKGYQTKINQVLRIVMEQSKAKNQKVKKKQ